MNIKERILLCIVILVLGLMLTFVYSEKNKRDDIELFVHYSFDSTDISDYHLINTVNQKQEAILHDTDIIAGKYQEAASLENKENSYIQLEKDIIKDLDAFTVSFWLKPNNTDVETALLEFCSEDQKSS